MISSLELSALDGSNGFVINGIDSNDGSGHSVSNAGDINGDGIDDLIIGARYADLISGESYVVFGNSTGGFSSGSLELSALDGSNGFVINGIDSADVSGFSVSHAGDINGDGIDDLIIGALYNRRAGESYVVFGSSSGGFSSGSLELSALDGSNGFAINGIDGDDLLGPQGVNFSVSNAGDINGDGIDDLVISAPWDISARWVGESYVVFGNSGGSFSSGSLELSDLNGTNGFVISGDGDVGWGFSVSNGGDINGDGIDDLVIGHRGEGKSYVVFGNSGGGFSSGSLELSALNGSNGFVINGLDSDDTSGFSVSNAGDINGDGIDDLVIGDPNADSNGNSSAGASYVVFGNSTGGFSSGSLELSALDGSNGFVINGIDSDDFSGFSVSHAGDINGDGIDDLIIGILGPYAGPNGLTSGESYVIFGSSSGGFSSGSLELSDLDGSNGFVINGIDIGDFSGFSVSHAGDINGDGIDDLVIGAPGADPNGNSGAGESYVIFGQSSNAFPNAKSFTVGNLDSTTGFSIGGSAAGDVSGYSVSSAGDINGDGFEDLIIGAPNADPNGDKSGESYVIFGSSSGFTSSPSLSSLDGSNGFVIKGIDANDRAGISVSTAGDINADGFDDIIVGAFLADPSSSETGESYVIFGNSSGFFSTLELSSLNGSNGFALNGIDDNDNMGRRATGIGDVNGDGIDDIIIGARLADPNGGESGESYVVFGSSSGFSSSLEISDLDGSNGFVLNGISAGDQLGWSVSGAGDINADGIDDFIIGAWLANPNGSDSGQSYVVFGSTAGFPSALEMTSLNGSNGFVLNGIDALDQAGYSVSNAGDINADGIDDIIIGARGASPNGDESGESYIVFGNSTGFSSSLELSDLDGSNGFTLNGIAAGDNTGTSVSDAGDVNGDGIDDIILGARYADPSGDSSGEAYVVFGRTTEFSASLQLSNLDGTEGFVLKGNNPGDELGGSVNNAGDLNNDGIDDIIVGARLADTNGSDYGESYIIYGNLAPKVDLNGPGPGLDSSAQFSGTTVTLFNSATTLTDFKLDNNGNPLPLDPNTATLEGLAITLNSIPDGTSEILTADTTGTSIVASYNFITCNLTLSGKDTLSNYEQVLKTVTYNNTATEFTIGTRTIEVIANDGGSFNNISPAASLSVLVNTPPTVSTGLKNKQTKIKKSFTYKLPSNTFSDADSSDSLTLTAKLVGRSHLPAWLKFDGNKFSGKPRAKDVGLSFIEVTATDSLSSKTSTIFSLTVNPRKKALGTKRRDILKGQKSAEMMRGRKGNDLLKGLKGNDIILGQNGKDKLLGGGGNDVLMGKKGKDRLVGGGGNDVLIGDAGRDKLSGKGGSDRFFVQNTKNFDIVTDFKPGIDKLVLDSRLALDDIKIISSGSSTRILLNDTSKVLMRLKNINALALDNSDIISLQEK